MPQLGTDKCLVISSATSPTANAPLICGIPCRFVRPTPFIPQHYHPRIRQLLEEPPVLSAVRVPRSF